MEEQTKQKVIITKERVMQELLDIPEQIYLMNKTIAKKRAYVEELKETVDRIEMTVIKYVTDLTQLNDKGEARKVYPNEISRQAEIKRQLNEDETHTKYIILLREEQAKLREHEIDIEFLYAKLKTYHTIAPNFYGEQTQQ